MSELSDTDSSISYPCNVRTRHPLLAPPARFVRFALANPFLPYYPACSHQHRLSVRTHTEYSFCSSISLLFLAVYYTDVSVSRSFFIFLRFLRIAPLARLISRRNQFFSAPRKICLVLRADIRHTRAGGKMKFLRVPVHNIFRLPVRGSRRRVRYFRLGFS